MSDLVAHFHFIRPLWLLAIVPALLCFYLLLSRQRHNTQWTSIIKQELLPYLLDGKFSQTQKLPLYGLLALWLIATVALAGPTWQKKPQPIQKDASAMVILWDMSPSMYAQDLKPSRLVRSRLKLMDLLDKRKEGLTGLIAYAGDAHVVTPLTDDIKTIKSLLPGLNPDVMPASGSQPEGALELALQLLQDTGINKGEIIFVTDGIARDAFTSLSTAAAQAQHSVSVWGIGTQEGSPIPLPSGGFAKSSRGEIVVAKLDDEQLSDAAIAMGGAYIPFSTSNQDIDSLLHFSSNTEFSDDGSSSSRQFDQWLEQGHWLVILMLPFAAFAFRRGWLICALPFFIISPDSQALSWQDLWQTKDQQGQALLESDQAQEAANTFKDPNWRAIANYEAQNFEAAEQAFANDQGPIAQYNKANALTQLGKYDEAISAYEQALAESPDFTEAKENKAIAEQLKELSEQQNQQGQNGENSEQEDQDGESQDGQSQQNSDSSQNGQNQQGEQQDGDNAGEQNANQQEQNGSESAAQEGDGENLDQAQKQALDRQYQQGDEASEDEETVEQYAEQQEKPQGEQGDKESVAAVTQQMSAEEKEKAQALEQWLRRVPDDPSGLLRNKFRYEHQQRRREMQSRSLRSPQSTGEERW